MFSYLLNTYNKIKRKKRIYADWSATTPIHKEVLKSMNKANENWHNPSSIYSEGVNVKKILDDNRRECAKILSCKPDEIYFTSGGTESNNLIIKGVINYWLSKGKKMQDLHIISSTIEHSSILETLKSLEEKGLKVSYVNPNSQGIINSDDVLALLCWDTILVTIMYVNNEIGTINPISKIGAGIRKFREENRFPLFHSDASQSSLWLSCDAEGLRVDALTLDAHKMQGPKGIGVLLLKRGFYIEPLFNGGGQEGGIRPTTESLSLISGFTKALSLAQLHREARSKKLQEKIKPFIERVKNEIPNVKINGSLEKRIPNNVNISIENISDPEIAVLKMDNWGIACSTKSSCLKNSESSYVVKSLGGEDWISRNTLRLSFSPEVTKQELNRVIDCLKKI